ncbi:hypothetical protein FB446DRAFT_786373 [Lentinula raphanica]|nr:hypothetical protein FB446DRAFT_786373 [Lentinula raphanica]
MYINGDFALIPYLMYSLVLFHPLFQECGAPKVEQGQEDWDNVQPRPTDIDQQGNLHNP